MDEWPEFVTELLAMGATEGGWDKALEMQLDLEVAANQKLNKLAWCYLTLSLEGEALDEMDIIPDENAYAVCLHLNRKYKPRFKKAKTKFGIESEKEREAFTVCDQMRKPTEEQCLERQKDKGYCYIDLWNEDFEAVKVEDETEEAKEEGEKKEKEDKPLVEDNKEDPIREEETPEDDDKEKFSNFN